MHRKSGIELIVRFATVLALAIWFGGFMFYFTAVISTSQKVLHSMLRAGLITQQVTNWLNRLSVPALLICGANWFVARRKGRRFWGWALGLSLAAMVLFKAVLFPTHWILDGRIVNREVADEGGFFRLHRLYFDGAMVCHAWLHLGEPGSVAFGGAQESGMSQYEER